MEKKNKTKIEDLKNMAKEIITNARNDNLLDFDDDDEEEEGDGVSGSNGDSGNVGNLLDELNDLFSTPPPPHLFVFSKQSTANCWRTNFN